MRVILSGGGTGGHIYPAITISRAIQEKVKACEVLFVGTKQGLEADIIPKEGYAFSTVNVSGFERRFTLKNLTTLFQSAASVWQSQRIIRKFKPDIVIGTGGYVCGPVLLAASLLGVPTMVQEQNVIPGITNKILARFVNKIAVGYADAANYFPQKEKIVYTGNPIRPEVMSASREEGIAALGLDPEKRTILISGGSRGARSINNAMIDIFNYFTSQNDVQLLHVTGKSEYNGIVGKLEQAGIDITSTGNISIKPYLYNMPLALAAADLAIFRAGAVGLAELTARGIPSILIPYPYAAENHQEHNASVMKRYGAAAVILDKNLTGDTLLALVNELINDCSRLKKMAAASKSLGRPEAAGHIAQLAIELADL
ncbi:UDP-N-acetylglucosamine--N-acetylmuramyl-(pentapeptide) pyrophosphoryl-undecaprenol N-acetylglucosamine transferase [bioreactor metagenome]|uniref:UDP-N-acetylglucosamine--N-acetylmuramyl-(Pentapeptide) pyrophosphoryl-undecaprenol N-acetylglucosamine transferase n=1 Tax=bioreactor metagenome TaxID=1076179 RepID=A0A644T363_9ZZZZ|nr:undecaprenyldiphospho-muramoylpentapeptide beta-N-acetylglucosaminyltransferase [Negativicutes bacterium]